MFALVDGLRNHIVARLGTPLPQRVEVTGNEGLAKEEGRREREAMNIGGASDAGSSVTNSQRGTAVQMDSKFGSCALLRNYSPNATI